MASIKAALTPAALEAAALDYLRRFSSSSESLRRVLLQRVARAAEAASVDPAEGQRMVAEILARYLAAGLLDDRAYALQQAASLARRGVSAQGIRHRLAQKGVGGDLIRAALAALAAEGVSELAAACALTRRRRLGPYRTPEGRSASHGRDLGILARAGFSLAIARRVLAAADIEALDSLAQEKP
jgi:regulatory protein